MLGELSRKLAFIGDAPVLKISALTGKGVHKLRPVLQEAIDAVPPPGADPRRQPGASPTPSSASRPAAGRKVLYAVQGATDPPTFTLFANRELPAHVPALPRALDPRGVRVRLDAAQAARAAPDRVTPMPWCEDCAKYWAPSAMTPEGSVPDLRRATSRRPTARRGGRRPPSDEKAPWHFKLLVVLLVVYLGGASSRCSSPDRPSERSRHPRPASDVGCRTATGRRR